ncbi:MAG: hypothetical protein AAFN77_18435 [Planctomycetota bacterium]
MKKFALLGGLMPQVIPVLNVQARLSKANESLFQHGKAFTADEFLAQLTGQQFWTVRLLEPVFVSAFTNR